MKQCKQLTNNWNAAHDLLSAYLPELKHLQKQPTPTPPPKSNNIY